MSKRSRRSELSRLRNIAKINIEVNPLIRATRKDLSHGESFLPKVEIRIAKHAHIYTYIIHAYCACALRKHTPSFRNPLPRAFITATRGFSWGLIRFRSNWKRQACRTELHSCRERPRRDLGYENTRANPKARNRESSRDLV